MEDAEMLADVRPTMPQRGVLRMTMTNSYHWRFRAQIEWRGRAAYLARVPQAYSGATGEESEVSRALIAGDLRPSAKPDSVSFVEEAGRCVCMWAGSNWHRFSKPWLKG